MGRPCPPRDLPQLPLDNNTAERALRNSVIGRKNFYGSGARWAADLAADVWTITATAARNGLEPLPLLEGYLTACAQAAPRPPDRRPASTKAQSVHVVQHPLCTGSRGVSRRPALLSLSTASLLHTLLHASRHQHQPCG